MESTSENCLKQDLLEIGTVVFVARRHGTARLALGFLAVLLLGGYGRNSTFVVAVSRESDNSASSSFRHRFLLFDAQDLFSNISLTSCCRLRLEEGLFALRRLRGAT